MLTASVIVLVLIAVISVLKGMDDIPSKKGWGAAGYMAILLLFGLAAIGGVAACFAINR